LSYYDFHQVNHRVDVNSFYQTPESLNFEQRKIQYNAVIKLIHMKPNLLKPILVILICLTMGSCRKSAILHKSPTSKPPFTGFYIMNKELKSMSSLKIKPVN